jgi:hypothetical protein
MYFFKNGILYILMYTVGYNAIPSCDSSFLMMMMNYTNSVTLNSASHAVDLSVLHICE